MRFNTVYVMLWVSDIEEFLLNERLISDAENTTEDTKENKEPEKASVVGENNKEESSENNAKEETTNKMKETESKVE